MIAHCRGKALNTVVFKNSRKIPDVGYVLQTFDDRIMFTGKGSLHICRLPDLDEELRFEIPDTWVVHNAFVSRDRKYAVVVARDNSVYVFNLKDKNMTRFVTRDASSMSDPLLMYVTEGMGTVMVIVWGNGNIQCWDYVRGLVVLETSSCYYVTSKIVHHAEMNVFFIPTLQGIMVWDFSDDAPTKFAENAKKGDITCMTLIDTVKMAVSTSRGWVVIFDVFDGKVLHEYRPSYGYVDGLSVTSDKEHFVCFCSDMIVDILRIKDGVSVLALYGFSPGLRASVCSPDGKYFACISKSDTLHVIELIPSLPFVVSEVVVMDKDGVQRKRLLSDGNIHSSDFKFPSYCFDSKETELDEVCS